MESYISNDKCVAKYVHDDGSETSIKTWPDGVESCGGSGREKFNVFISSSVGCPIRCSFCYLTSKDFPYHQLSAADISTNVIDAINMELSRRPELKNLPMNLSFMGMGDAWMDLEKTYQVVRYICSWFPELKIEGVDIGTTLPLIKWDDQLWLLKIKNYLIRSGRLTDRPISRKPVRIFFSLHSFFDDYRHYLIPRSIPIKASLEYLRTLEDTFNVIYHYVLFEGINDQHKDFSAIIDHFLYQPRREIRFLRYNQCPNSKFKESQEFNSFIERLERNKLDNMKVQLSPGSEVAAACGMFLMKEIE